jgi:hypothetical protein
MDQYYLFTLPGDELVWCEMFTADYGGSAHSFGFAIYSHVSERYEDAVLLTGSPTGTPQEALDTACTIHLAGLGHEPDSEPSTNVRSQPLRASAGRRRCVGSERWPLAGCPEVVWRRVPHRLAAGLMAGDGDVPAIAGASAAARQPSARHLARSPAVTVLALDRIRPPGRQAAIIHLSIGTPAR